MKITAVALLALSAISLTAQAGDHAFRCTATEGKYAFEALGNVNEEGFSGEVIGNVYRNGQPFQTAHSEPAESNFEAGKVLSFVAKSLIVKVTVDAKFDGAGSYVGVMTVKSLLGSPQPMRTVCKVK